MPRADRIVLRLFVATTPVSSSNSSLIEANLLAIAVVVASLTMASSALLKPGQTVSRHKSGSDNAENNADFPWPLALHTPTASFKLPTIALFERMIRCLVIFHHNDRRWASDRNLSNCAFQ